MTAVPCNPPSLRRLTGRLLSALTLPALLLLGGCLALRDVSAPSAAPVASPTGSSEHQVGAATPTATPARARPASALPLAAVFAAWYGYAADGNCQGGMGSYHWNNDPNMAGVMDQPEPGFYCSADPTVIHWQLDRLEDAGVQALFVSWWGWGDIDLDGVVEGHADASLNRGIQALLAEIVAAQQPISVSLIVEPFVQTQGHITPSLLLPAQRALVLDWLWANYYGREEYCNLWFQWTGKPLLLAFDPMTLTTALAPITPISYTVRHWTGCARQEDARQYAANGSRRPGTGSSARPKTPAPAYRMMAWPLSTRASMNIRRSSWARTTSPGCRARLIPC